jgi:hypothetical protein
MGFFGLRSLLERVDLTLNVCGILFVRPTSCIQGVLRFVDGTLPSLALLAPSSLFLRAFTIATLLRLLESECGLPVGRVVGGSLRMFCGLRLGDLRPALFELASPARSVGSSAFSLKVPLEPMGRFKTMPGTAIVAAMTSGSSLCFAAP